MHENTINFNQAGKNYLSILRNHVLQKRQHEDARIYLFGSWARGNQRNSSDIDIAIEYKSGEGYSKINELRESIEESSIPYRVDVVDMRRISGLFVEKIRKDGVVEGIEVASPKGVIRHFREIGIFDNMQTEQALQMADDRNLTKHTYDEAFALEIAKRVIEHEGLLWEWYRKMTKI